jgi:prepilin-type N-terminal cleavage/methylation domain-containing protein
MTIDSRRNTADQHGFTLIEATLAMVLLGVAAAGVLLPFAGGASAQADGSHRTVAAILANDQIERIVSSTFAQLLANCDASPYTETEAEGQVKDASGTRFYDPGDPESDPMYANFSRQTTYQKVRVSPQVSEEVTANFILATVTVSYRSQPLATVRRLISK